MVGEESQAGSVRVPRTMDGHQAAGSWRNMGSVGFSEKSSRTCCVTSWSDMDLQPSVQGDSGTLRSLSARVLSVVRNRDMKNFEKVMEFSEATHRRFPRSVPAIKHMKIQFGSKTMIIMWMSREGRGMVHIVSTIVRFFPNKSPQYEGQCSRREMFSMRKNHADFKSSAQNSAIDPERSDDYMKEGMESQYGERYAQKVEDRSSDYSQESQKFLPGDGSVPKMMKNPGGEDEEDQLLSDETFSDSSAVRKPSFSEVPASRPPQSDGDGAEMETAAGRCEEEDRNRSEDGEPEGVEPEDVESEDVEPEGGEPEDVESEDVEPEGGEPEDVEPEDVEPEGGEPEDVESEDVEPEDVEPEDVEPEGGEPEGGEPEDVESEGGEPEGGVPEDVEPEGGEPEGGEPEDGEPEDVESEGGESEGGEPEGGEPEDVESEGGESEGGESEGGEPEDGEPEDVESEGGEPEGGAGAAQKEEPMSSPQFCSKHQRWVENISTGCPEDDLFSSSPSLFPSSSSTSSSSQDLTPSNSDLQPSTRPPSSADPEGSARPARSVPVVRSEDISSFSWSGGRPVSVVSSQEGRWRSGASAPSGDQNLSDLQPPPADPVPSPWAQERLHRNSAGPKTQNSRTFQCRPASGSSRTSQLQPRPSPPTQTGRSQPYVVSSRSSAEACSQATGGRFWAGPGADEDECSFDVNASYSSDPSSSEDEDRTGCDPDYRPHVKKKRLRSEVRFVSRRTRFGSGPRC